jgi:hypothetical protein
MEFMQSGEWESGRVVGTHTRAHTTHNDVIAITVLDTHTHAHTQHTHTTHHNTHTTHTYTQVWVKDEGKFWPVVLQSVLRGGNNEVIGVNVDCGPPWDVCWYNVWEVSLGGGLLAVPYTCSSSPLPPPPIPLLRFPPPKTGSDGEHAHSSPRVPLLPSHVPAPYLPAPALTPAAGLSLSHPLAFAALLPASRSTGTPRWCEVAEVLSLVNCCGRPGVTSRTRWKVRVRWLRRETCSVVPLGAFAAGALPVPALSAVGAVVFAGKEELDARAWWRGELTARGQAALYTVA